MGSAAHRQSQRVKMPATMPAHRCRSCRSCRASGRWRCAGPASRRPGWPKTAAEWPKTAALVRELAEQRQAAGLSQTEIAARMGTSQSAVARLESGTADVRASTLERYAAAVGGQITWKLNRPGEGASE